MPDHLPLPPPPAPSDASPPTLTEEQDGMQKKVHEYFSKPDYTLPNEKDGILSDEEKMWLSYECMLRYLRATKWDVSSAIKRLEGTLKWRRDYGLYTTITPEHVEPEALTGKEVVFGYDLERRPALYLIPSRQNTEESPRQIEFNVWMLERTIDLMGPGVETLALMINFGEKSKIPSFGTAKTVLDILQNHYPERLGRALIINVPWLVNTFFKMITPFIDPITRPKLKFNPNVVKDELFAADMVMKDNWSGSRDFVWEHEQYFPALVKLCSERKRAMMERWKQLGGSVGLKEWDMKTGSSANQTMA
ncbi:CRAL/TRIO domain-containing protein [Gloeophyllum trabeum ATCC 11539]|uniref:CRAL/TRIO domain-containing protein n=1 Tax=Gloeophyllum trabeum (strain ATCC 11539 / FP-39264 / Madison 617) TaxID=670483 RepID=S7PYZ4_GLOTA|nr:CRAL/TRIO domain-containing protein [Gloeophyllum trabeum ATCC 11539]EPQ52871.1 CRAL/TRIO domain-containing protein [Gloeophyllum trabeum ATCC 11539]